MTSIGSNSSNSNSKQLKLTGANTSQITQNTSQGSTPAPAQCNSQKFTTDETNQFKFGLPGSSRSTAIKKAENGVSEPSSTTPPGGNLNQPFAPLDPSKMGLEGLGSLGKGLGDAFSALSKLMQQNQQNNGQDSAQQPPPPPPPPPQG